jgi:HD-GYP domain-containing protein (c-di-GMP phosphodiesterase class II)
MACAHACEILGRHVEKAATPKLFLLGLLHDVGKLAIL